LGQGGEMTQALYAHMNNKIKKKKRITQQKKKKKKKKGQPGLHSKTLSQKRRKKEK
jgi:hypothetical protein